MTERLFERIDLSDTLPPGICQTCASHSLVHQPTETLFTYCEHNECGAMRRPGGNWITSSPITADLYRNTVVLAVLEAEALFIDAQAGGLSAQ